MEKPASLICFTQIQDSTKKKEIARSILEGLPEWFGIEQAREEYRLSVKACGISEGFALVGSGSYPLASGRNTRHLDSHSPFVEPSLSGY